MEKDNWETWSNFVLKELERLNRNQEDANKQMTEIKGQIIQLQVRAGLWGGLGGLIPIAIVIILKLLKI